MLRLDAFSFPNPLGEGRQYPPSHDRDRVDQMRELARAKNEKSHVAFGGHRGGAWRLVKESHLAEAVAGAELDASLSTDRHLRPTIGDHESLAPRIALAHQDQSSGDFNLLGEGCDTGEIALGAGREKLDLREPFDLGIPRPSGPPHRHEYLTATDLT